MSFGHVKHIWARYPEEEAERRKYRYRPDINPCADNKIYICVRCKTVVSVFHFWGIEEVKEHGTALCGVECDEAVIEDVMNT